MHVCVQQVKSHICYPANTDSLERGITERKAFTCMLNLAYAEINQLSSTLLLMEMDSLPIILVFIF